MKGQSLGLIETWGFVPAVVAADAASKAAIVSLLGFEPARGGLVTVKVSVDAVGAGVGERVILVTGSGARKALNDDDCPVDATIVGIIDHIDVEELD